MNFEILLYKFTFKLQILNLTYTYRKIMRSIFLSTDNMVVSHEIIVQSHIEILLWLLFICSSVFSLGHFLIIKGSPSTSFHPELPEFNFWWTLELWCIKHIIDHVHPVRIFSQSISQRTWNMVASLQMGLQWSLNPPVTYLGEIRDYHIKEQKWKHWCGCPVVYRLRLEDFDINRFILSHLLDTKLRFVHIFWWPGLIITWQGQPMALASCVHSTVCAMFGYIIAFYSCLKINRKQNWECFLRSLALWLRHTWEGPDQSQEWSVSSPERLSLNHQAG